MITHLKPHSKDKSICGKTVCGGGGVATSLRKDVSCQVCLRMTEWPPQRVVKAKFMKIK